MIYLYMLFILTVSINQVKIIERYIKLFLDIIRWQTSISISHYGTTILTFIIFNPASLIALMITSLYFIASGLMIARVRCKSGSLQEIVELLLELLV